MKRTFTVVAGLTLVAGLAFGQQVVNQGRPGTQGPWPVSISGASGNTMVVGPDGGAVVVQNAQCTGASAHKITTVGAAAVNTPSAQNAGRMYIVLCNSLQNSSNPIVKCRIDGVAPVAASGNAGDVLGIGDCIRYDIPAAVVPQCISDAAGTNVTSFEC